MALSLSFGPKIDQPDPMIEMNTTPLIDVLLVLLIMLIVTIPAQTHATKMDLPSEGPVITINRTMDEITVTRGGAYLWNNAAVSRRQLADLLDRIGTMPTPPEVHLRPDPDARYEAVDDVLATARRAQVGTLGFVGNEGYANF